MSLNEEPDRAPLLKTLNARYEPEEVADILERVRWDLMGCWMYTWKGMWLGIEPDGYGPHS